METHRASAPLAEDFDSSPAKQMVVGVGASAGGLKALQQFFEAVPADSGLAYVVIVHLDPERPSRMAELLQERTQMPVLQVGGLTEVQADHCYVIPPGHDLMMRGSMLELRARGERSDHAPVDLFLRTLAESHGSDSAGVILSGTGSDGTAGIAYIREAGGITAAQLPEEAEYEGMPASAIATGLVDVVASSAGIPAELMRLQRLVPDLTADAAGNGGPDGALNAVLATLRGRTGHDFSFYKRSTVLRRLERRLQNHGVATLEEYLPLLRGSETEHQSLLRDLLISVSSFFRDPEAFAALATLTPTLFKGKGPGDAVRAWVVGCATGEEAYSVAMVLAEHAATLSEPPRIQVFATDIDEHGYAWARAGLYSGAAVANMAPERLQRFFSKESGGYRVVKSLRELVLFAGHNVLHDPPFSHMDLVSCRNLFIYLQPSAQERALETFHFSLNLDGLLFLGAAESVGESGLFVPAAGKTQRLFRRGAWPPREAHRASRADPLKAVPLSATATSNAAAESRPPPRFPYGGLHVRMLEQYAPPSVIVDESLAVVHLSTGAGRFLRLGNGEPNHNLLALLAPEPRRALRTCLHQAFEKGVASTRRTRMELDGAERHVSLHVRPSTEDGSAGRFALIIFEAEDNAGQPPVAGTPAGNGGQVASELEEELRRTRELLESTHEAHDSIVAELQTVNEELQSTNEEQKAAAEEVETSREEIQSINEELVTINQEHQGTIEELKRTNSDLQNLIESTEIGTIFLDRAMRVRRFTPSVSTLFNFLPTDLGRPFSHITHHLDYDDLAADVGKVLASRVRMEREVSSDHGQSYIVRISPYRSQEGENEGAVLTFFDNTARHQAAEELREAKLAAEAANQAKSTFLSTLSHEFRTPLNAIVGYADLLTLDGSLSAPQEHKVERLKTAAWHLSAMIEEILAFSRLDSGRQSVDRASLDARAIAHEAGTLVEPAATAKQLAFVLDLPESPLPIVTDAAKVRQILVNLCSNAIKYTPAGEVRLRTRVVNGGVAFDVSDTGIGIAAEHHSRVFERFWQVDADASRTAGGLGIGLAAAREYARLLGGDVTLESALGSGSTFRLWLPAS